MTFRDAATKQYNRTSIYTVWLVGPTGEREQLGTTARQTGRGLLGVLSTKSVQSKLAAMPNMGGATFTKKSNRLELSNGWRIEFGGTIRQEATE